MNDQNLTTEEIDILKAYARGGMLKPIIPPRVKQHLISLGFIDERLGGPVITGKGRLHIMPGLKRRIRERNR